MTEARWGRPPVILQVLPSLVSGGVERGTVDIAAALRARGWKALVASSGGPMVYDLHRVGAKHVKLPLDARNPLSIRSNANQLVRLMRHAGVDLIHARSRAPAWSAVRAARKLGVPFVTTFHGAYGARVALKRRYNAVMLRGDRVVATSQFIADHIRATYRAFDTSRLVMIPRGVDLQMFNPAAVSGVRVAALCKKWRLDDDVPVILLPARFTRWKGHAVLIDAVAWMRRTDTVCVLVGSDTGRQRFRRELQTRARRRGLEDRVRFAGRESDMPAAYMLAAAVVSASTEPEAFGRVTAEAQAMGRPVVATHHGGSCETLLEGETGWLVPPRDPAALAAALDDAVSLDPWSRQLLASRARGHVERRFNLVGMCDSTLAVYRELLTAASPAS